MMLDLWWISGGMINFLCAAGFDVAVCDARIEWFMMARIFGAAIVSRSFPCNLVGDPLSCCKNFVICCGT